MNQGLYSGVAAMRAAERRLEAVTANLVHAGTPAYKARATATHAFALPDTSEHQVRTSFSTRYAQGDLSQTGNPLHLALEGPGFFVVEGPQGELLTRRGDFALDASGVLVDAGGLPVAFEGRAVRIDPTGPTLAIDGAGTVRQGEAELGRLRIVDFERLEGLERLGGGLFRASQASTERLHGAVVHQGALESSNTSTMDQLVELVQVQRSFEATARVMSLIEQSYKSLIERR